jgi:rRNA maturation RNase YbeY
MITVSVTKEKAFQVSARDLSSRVKKIFTDGGIVSNAEASVAVVTAGSMLAYVEKYLHEKGEEAAAHPVLSFVQSEIEGPFSFPPDDILHLGEIIVSFDHAKEQAVKSGKTAGEEAILLAEHAALHLMGVHHE